MAKFAANTDVSVEKSRAEIEGLIVRYGATSTAFFNGPGKAIIAFEAKSLNTGSAPADRRAPLNQPW